MKNNQQDPKGKQHLKDQKATPETRKNETRNSAVNEKNERTTSNSRNISDDTTRSKDGRAIKDTPANRTGSNEQPLNRNSDSKKKSSSEELEFKDKNHPHKRRTPESDDLSDNL